MMDSKRLLLYRRALDRQEEKKAREEEERAERVIAANKGRIQARPILYCLSTQHDDARFALLDHASFAHSTGRSD